MSENTFGFGAAVKEATGFDLPVAPKRIERALRTEGREVAAEEGFHRRAPIRRPGDPAEPAKKAVGRIRLNEGAPRRGVRYQGEARVQLNIMTPLPVAEDWRRLMEEAPVQQWELLEAAVPLLRQHFGLDEDR